MNWKLKTLMAAFVMILVTAVTCTLIYRAKAEEVVDIGGELAETVTDVMDEDGIERYEELLAKYETAIEDLKETKVFQIVSQAALTLIAIAYLLYKAGRILNQFGKSGKDIDKAKEELKELIPLSIEIKESLMEIRNAREDLSTFKDEFQGIKSSIEVLALDSKEFVKTGKASKAIAALGGKNDKSQG